MRKKTCSLTRMAWERGHVLSFKKKSRQPFVKSFKGMVEKFGAKYCWWNNSGYIDNQLIWKIYVNITWVTGFFNIQRVVGLGISVKSWLFRSTSCLLMKHFRFLGTVIVWDLFGGSRMAGICLCISLSFPYQLSGSNTHLTNTDQIENLLQEANFLWRKNT